MATTAHYATPCANVMPRTPISAREDGCGRDAELGSGRAPSARPQRHRPSTSDQWAGVPERVLGPSTAKYGRTGPCTGDSDVFRAPGRRFRRPDRIGPEHCRKSCRGRRFRPGERPRPGCSTWERPRAIRQAPGTLPERSWPVGGRSPARSAAISKLSWSDIALFW